MEDFDTHKGCWIQNQLSVCHFLETLSLVSEASLLSPKLKSCQQLVFPCICVFIPGIRIITYLEYTILSKLPSSNQASSFQRPLFRADCTELKVNFPWRMNFCSGIDTVLETLGWLLGWEDPLDTGAWRAAVQRVAESHRTKKQTEHYC